MFNKFIFVLLVQFYRLLDATDIFRPEVEVIICENRKRTVECERNQSLSIISASYGRTNKTACPHRANRNINCLASTSKQIISGECKNKTSCVVKASNGIFGDPCPGTFKYVNLTYQCSENIEKQDISTMASNMTENIEKQDLSTLASNMTAIIIGLVIVSVIIVMCLLLLLYRRLKVTRTDSAIINGSVSKAHTSRSKSEKTTISYDANAYEPYRGDDAEHQYSVLKSPSTESAYEPYRGDDTEHHYSDLKSPSTESIYYSTPNTHEYVNTKSNSEH